MKLYSTELVVHTDTVVVHKHTNGSSRHGKYADIEGRKEYRRNWMRKKRMMPENERDAYDEEDETYPQGPDVGK
jgi:hypothetical protein